MKTFKQIEQAARKFYPEWAKTFDPANILGLTDRENTMVAFATDFCEHEIANNSTSQLKPMKPIEEIAERIYKHMIMGYPFTHKSDIEKILREELNPSPPSGDLEERVSKSFDELTEGIHWRLLKDNLKGVRGPVIKWAIQFAQQELTSQRWVPVQERLPEDKYMKRITLCGSTKFKKEFEALNKQLTLEGNVVYSVAFFGHADKVEMTPEQKQLVDRVHKAKIDNSDAILVIDVDGYIGESTRSEIQHAEKTGKVVRYLSDFPDLVSMCDSITMADAFAEPLPDKPIINPPSGEK